LNVGQLYGSIIMWDKTMFSGACVVPSWLWKPNWTRWTDKHAK